MAAIHDLLQHKKILISDGAWGTFLYEKGLQAGECPELWNLTHRDDVLAIAKSYVDAGADMILTNSFGGSPYKLAHYQLEDRAFELNQKAAEISREAAGDQCLVLGSIGPTGALLMMGDVPEQELYDGFFLQAQALKKGGADAICVETMSALDEAVLAIKAARTATALEVVCTFTFNKGVDNTYKTMMGVSPEAMVTAVLEAGASIIGSNCGNGFDQMMEIVSEIRKINSEIPVLVHANAGLPVIQAGLTCYPETAGMMASKLGNLIRSGADIIGGCCGTTPEHIRMMVEAVKKYR